jgi:hypothetical protein
MISIKVEGIEYRFYDHLFAVSACGKVLRTFQPYEPRDYRPDGYRTLGRKRLMHRVVATCWIPNPDNKEHVHHINGDRKDNRASNLQWLTPKEHIGESHPTNGYYVRTPEILEKYRQVQLGRKDSEETKALKKVTLDAYRNKRGCKVNGITYQSMSEGARATGMLLSSFAVRCRSKNFPDYELI